MGGVSERLLTISSLASFSMHTELYFSYLILCNCKSSLAFLECYKLQFTKLNQTKTSSASIISLPQDNEPAMWFVLILQKLTILC